MNILFGVIGFLCLVYHVVLVAYAGFGASFAFFWLAAAVLCGILSVLFGIRRFRLFLKGLPLWVKVPVRTTVALGLLCFLLVEGLIIFHMAAKPTGDLDYLVVLGAKVQGETPTKSLCFRLDAAAEYLADHPGTRVVVTGGKGPGEDISEAAAMRNYLVEKGIDRKRIIMERYASNTQQNLAYSKSLIGNDEAKVGVVTNDFHVFRAVSLAKKLGIRKAVGLPAKSDGMIFPNMMVREFFAVVKDKFLGNI